MTRPAGIVVVTGPPAAGKTTASRLQARRHEPSVHLHADDFWAFIQTGYVDPWLPASHAQNDVVIRAVCAAAVTFAAGGYHVVLDGVVGPWFLDLLLDAAASHAGKAHDIDVHYVVLLPPLDVVLANLAGRAGHGFTSVEATTKMHGEFATAAVGLDRHVLDPTGMSPQEIADRIEAAVASGELLSRARRRAADD